VLRVHSDIKPVVQEVYGRELRAMIGRVQVSMI
jgi:hypothetical protein